MHNVSFHGNSCQSTKKAPVYGVVLAMMAASVLGKVHTPFPQGFEQRSHLTLGDERRYCSEGNSNADWACKKAKHSVE